MVGFVYASEFSHRRVKHLFHRVRVTGACGFSPIVATTHCSAYRQPIFSFFVYRKFVRVRGPTTLYRKQRAVFGYLPSKVTRKSVF